MKKNESAARKKRRIQWHPGFNGGIKLEFAADKTRLKYIEDFVLNEKPIISDLLMVVKDPGCELQSDLGKIMRGHNLVEYKSPGDALGVKEYFCLMSYGCRLVMRGPDGVPVPPDDITLTFVRRERPRKLMKFLEASSMTIRSAQSGIYIVEGNRHFPMQIVVSGELDERRHIWLSSLTRSITAKKLDEMTDEAEALIDEDDRLNAGAVLSVLYDAYGPEEGSEMSDRLYELNMEVNGARIRREMEQMSAEGRAEGRLEGFLSGRVNAIVAMGREFGLMKDDIISRIASMIPCSRDEAERLMSEFGGA